MSKPFYCHQCGNPDCPLVSANPYWRKCPGQRKIDVHRAWLLHLVEEFAPPVREALLAPVYAVAGIDSLADAIAAASHEQIREWTAHATNYIYQELK